MENQDISRRTLLKGGGTALAGLTTLRIAGPAQAFGHSDGEVIPWVDQPAPNPGPFDSLGNFLVWEKLDSWLTPAHNFFFVNHYGPPKEPLDESTWRVEISGLVARPQSLSIADLKARVRHDVDFTLECSGNSAFDFFIGGVGNARWGGTPLALLLEEASILDEGSEVVFWGADSGEVTIRDNGGILNLGKTGKGVKNAAGSYDLTITEQFARSMSVREALNRDNLLCYAMNGEPLPPEHGAPVRLIAPGWFGVANVKWLKRIEIMDHRWAGRFMARDYVSIREQERNGETVWTFTTVSHERLKSAPAKVTRHDGRYAIMGAAWGAPIAAVEVQVDNGPWMPTRLDRRPHGIEAETDEEHLTANSGDYGHSRRRRRDYSWRFWHFNWGTPATGEHRIRSRAFDTDGNMQPAPDDPFLASRITYWEANGQITRKVLIQ
jgi:DMSO/TMAO reductase YedYZ molybdopterin-dependent catalytic subunit